MLSNNPLCLYMYNTLTLCIIVTFICLLKVDTSSPKQLLVANKFIAFQIILKHFKNAFLVSRSKSSGRYFPAQDGPDPVSSSHVVSKGTGNYGFGAKMSEKNARPFNRYSSIPRNQTRTRTIQNSNVNCYLLQNTSV